MKSEEIINSWKNQKDQIEIGEDFSRTVMNQIYKYEQNKRKPLFDIQRFVEFISIHPLAKAALVAAGAMAGFLRLVSMIIVILSKGEISG